MFHLTHLVLAVAGVIAGSFAASGTKLEETSDPLPPTDLRAKTMPVNLDTPRTFPHIRSLAEWEKRRAAIRKQVLVSCGLYPLPDHRPVSARVFGATVHDGYTIEKVSIQTYPGFYLAGNLYRPAGNRSAGSSAPGLHPGILVAHGHWEAGRFADGPDGSIPARAITFARMGCVAVTYDMVGFNDTRQIPQHRTFANDREHWLWGISLMGLQTWNSIRALDFLESLPDVDRSRLAITGESGGGTQTMMLGAIDDRLAAVAPCVMVSHSMQGGCLCENAPGLRIDYSNMEIAAAAAPRPQIMIGATGDWTRTMMTVEGPAVKSIYKLYGKADNCRYVAFPFGHNINQTSREAVDAFFNHVLLHQPDGATFTEPPYQVEPIASLQVFPEGTALPADAMDADSLTRYLIKEANGELKRLKPQDTRGLARFKEVYQEAWAHTLGVDAAPESLNVATDNSVASAGLRVTEFHLGRNGRGDNIPCVLLTSNGGRSGSSVVLAHPQGIAQYFDRTSHAPHGLALDLVKRGVSVLLLDAFLTGQRADPAAESARKPFENFFTTYNRTDLQERVQDLLTAASYLRLYGHGRKVGIIGLRDAGLWALLAAPGVDAVAADCCELDLQSDESLLTDALFTPGLRRLGDFRTAATLAAPHPLFLHHTGSHFTSSPWITDVYRAIGHREALTLKQRQSEDQDIVNWIASATKASPAR